MIKLFYQVKICKDKELISKIMSLTNSPKKSFDQYQGLRL